jgi:lysozyme
LDDLLGHRRLLVRFEGAGEAVSPTIEAVEIAADLCRRFEGFRAAPYLCPAGVWTLGFGSTRHADGRPVAKTDPPVSREEAESLLRLDLSRFLSQVLAASPGLVSESPRRIAALVDFSYNLGAGQRRVAKLVCGKALKRVPSRSLIDGKVRICCRLHHIRGHRYAVAICVQK